MLFTVNIILRNVLTLLLIILVLYTLNYNAIFAFD